MTIIFIFSFLMFWAFFSYFAAKQVSKEKPIKKEKREWKKCPRCEYIVKDVFMREFNGKKEEACSQCYVDFLIGKIPPNEFTRKEDDTEKLG